MLIVTKRETAMYWIHQLYAVSHSAQVFLVEFIQNSILNWTQSTQQLPA